MATIIPLKVDSSGNISQFTSGDMLPASIIPGGGGGGGSGLTEGITEVNFGTGMGSNIATVTITGQTGVVASTTIVRASIRPITTVDNNAYEHIIAPIKVSVADLVTGVGFTIYATSTWRLNGIYSVQWSYQ